MQLLSKDEIKLRKEEILSHILGGKVFVYPTDTIYGIGCDATNKNSVDKIRKLKQRKDDPFSVIAPSKKWIQEHCEINEETKKWIDKLPGPYTLILKLKNAGAIAENVNNKSGTLGVRIPKHWIKDVVEKLGVPVVTTSANQSGKEFMTSLDNLDPEVKKGLDFTIYEGEKLGKPSTIIHLEGKEVKVKER